MTVKGNQVSMKRPSFVDAPRCDDFTSLDADVAIIGIPYTTPSGGWVIPSEVNSSLAPEAIREHSLRYAPLLHHYDFDLGGDVLAGRALKIVDCGDVKMVPDKIEENLRASTAAIRTILDQGAVPIVLGGDHGATIPALWAYEKYSRMCIVQIDAHLDWRDEVNGVREGKSSPLRRASEMPWVQSMIQIGLRGLGGARQREVDDARAYGSILIRAEELHEVGVEEVLRRVPPADFYYMTLDADGLDPSIAPGVRTSIPGGVTYYQTIKLMRGIARKGKVVGFDFVEVVPSLDIANMTSMFAARLILNFIGVLAYQGQIGSK